MAHGGCTAIRCVWQLDGIKIESAQTRSRPLPVVPPLDWTPQS
jgi:hypothetical protein